MRRATIALTLVLATSACATTPPSVPSRSTDAPSAGSQPQPDDKKDTPGGSGIAPIVFLGAAIGGALFLPALSSATMMPDTSP